MEEGDVIKTEEKVGDWAAYAIVVEIDAGDVLLFGIRYDVANEPFVISANIGAPPCVCNSFGIGCHFKPEVLDYFEGFFQ